MAHSQRKLAYLIQSGATAYFYGSIDCNNNNNLYQNCKYLIELFYILK